MVDWFSLTIPLAYLGVLVGSFATFSSLYRKRKAVKASSLQPWFPPHIARDIYLSLLHLDPVSSSTSSASKEKGAKTITSVPESVLKAALLRRALEDIRRLMELRNQKPALAGLLQKGSIGDNLWQQFLRAEKEMEEEFRDVMAEANAFAPGWGQMIFQSANEMYFNEALRERVTELQSTAKDEKEWWDRKRASIQEGFMKELEEEGGTGPSAKKTEKLAAPTPAATENKPVSDDDTVLVEAGGPAATSGSGGGAKKKKKGKK